nr:transporter substrate-binding domain-containing protein [Mesorhizobium sp.]
MTITRAFQLGFHFGPPVFYDGQGRLVRKDLGVTKAADLDGATSGVQSGTTGELNFADLFRKTGKKFTPVTTEDTGQFINALETGRVDAITQDSSDLVGKRIQLKKPDDYIILPERLSKEPLAPAATIAGWRSSTGRSTQPSRPRNGITSKHVDDFLESPDPAIQRFLGVDPSLAHAIGLNPTWAYNIIKTVGNLRPLGWERGYNSLWTNGRSAIFAAVPLTSSFYQWH